MKGELPEIIGSDKPIYDNYRCIRGTEYMFENFINDRNIIDCKVYDKNKSLTWHLREYENCYDFMKDLVILKQDISNKKIENDKQYMVLDYICERLRLDDIKTIYKMNRIDVDINKNKKNDLIWLLEHKEIYTAGTNYKEEEILNKDIKLIKTNRGGKITYHGPGQLICYFVIDLKQRKKDIRKFITLIEKTIIESLSEFNINSFGDPKNVGIWVKDETDIKKVAAIGVRVSKWIAYHGFAININNDLTKYQKIIPCGILDKGVTNLKSINDQNYHFLSDVIVNNFTKNLGV